MRPRRSIPRTSTSWAFACCRRRSDAGPSGLELDDDASRRKVPERLAPSPYVTSAGSGWMVTVSRRSPFVAASWFDGGGRKREVEPLELVAHGRADGGSRHGVRRECHPIGVEDPVRVDDGREVTGHGYAVQHLGDSGSGFGVRRGRPRDRRWSEAGRGEQPGATRRTLDRVGDAAILGGGAAPPA